MENKENNVFPKVFLWMFIGLLITFITGCTVSLNENMVYNIFSGVTRYILIIAELGIGIFLGAKIWDMKASTATCLYLLYTFLTGLTLSSIFIIYKLSSLFVIFFVAAILFGFFALIGKVLKLDLTKLTTFLLMGLIGSLLLGIVNIFLRVSIINTIISIISLIVFLGYTAVDIQRIKRMMMYSNDERKVAIRGAFSLYLDYINIVIDLLRLIGAPKRD